MEKMNYLEKTIEGMCGNKTATSAPSCKSSQVNWTSVPITLVGVSYLNEAANYSYIIPKLIPSNAREVLIYTAAKPERATYKSQGLRSYWN